VRIVAQIALALLRRSVRVFAFEDVLIVALEAKGLEVVVILDLEQQRLDASTMRIMAVGAVFRRVVDRFRRCDIRGDVFVTADAQVRRIFDRELVQVFLGLVALLTFSGFREIRPVDVRLTCDIGVTVAVRTRSGRVDRLGRFGRARPRRRHAE
jgi:hypothetical protein